nr:MAG TPA: hypothetical protein [Caudoviricetes sp.]
MVPIPTPSISYLISINIPILPTHNHASNSNP